MKLSELRNENLQTLSKRFGADQKSKVLQKFLALGLPDKKSESYRYFEIEKLLEKSYALCVKSEKPITESDKIEIVDGTVVSAPKGLRIYYAHSRAINRDHFDPLYYLGHLFSPAVIKIEIDGDAELELIHRFTQSDTLIPYRIVLETQPNRHATIYENFFSSTIKNSLVLYGYDMSIAKDSTLRVIKVQHMQEENYSMIASHSINVGEYASIIYKSFDMGGNQALQLIQANLDAYAHIDAGHLLYLNEESKRGTVSQIIHKGEHSTSQQEAKNILDGNARGIFDALIKVEPTAKYTKAKQHSKAILLNDKAYMVAKPQLEIYIDELEASHGATTGQLDKKQLFYLQSRGISALEARKILIIAFANTLIETIKDSRHQERIKAAFEDIFYRKDKESS